jgi:riboflavin biosynthesis pyrimidine reductase
MQRLPERPDLDHLRKQAKALLAALRHGEPEAIARIRASLPAAIDKSDAAIAALGLRLHDAQSALAREYGFVAWAELKGFVEIRAAAGEDGAARRLRWCRLVYTGDIAGGMDRARPHLAARLLEEDPALLADDPHLACAIGDVARLRRAIAADAAWINRAGGPLALPPLVAVTQSSLIRLPQFRDRLLAATTLLLEAGADPDQAVGSRWPPASLAAPSAVDRLSALHGAAGQNHDPEMTRLLLEAGADPNDGESLYHSLENPGCTRLLLEAGARIAGSNAMYRVLDLDDVDALRLLLAHGADPNEQALSRPTSDWGCPLLWAIRRRRSPAHVAALLAAGADPAARTPDGTGAQVWARRYGLPEVAALLREPGGTAEDSDAEDFVAACARGDAAEARRLQALDPGLPAALPETGLRLLPDLAAEGAADAVRLMVTLGWPIAIRGGDWDASALNHAVFRGDAALTCFLLAHGAHWTERHGFGADVCGTLGWASVNRPVASGDWPGCADALRAHGLPAAEPDGDAADSVILLGERCRCSDEVAEILLGAAP